MTPGLLKSLLAAAAFVTALAPSLAEARGLHVRVGGHVHVSGGVGVVVRTPPPPPRPVVYGGVVAGGVIYGEVGACNCEPAPVYPSYQTYPSYPQPYYAPQAAVVAAPPRRPMFGIGVMASSIDINDGELQGQGAGLLGRLRLTPGFQLELQLSQDRFVDNPRVDSRFGAAAIFDLGKPGGFTPYLVLGAGLNVIQPLGTDEAYQPDTLPTQGYLEAGIGLEWEIVPRLALSGDIRLQARRFDEESQATNARMATSTPMPEKEDAAEGRVNLILYF
jgi:hypothetical protein